MIDKHSLLTVGVHVPSLWGLLVSRLLAMSGCQAISMYIFYKGNGEYQFTPLKFVEGLTPIGLHVE